MATSTSLNLRAVLKSAVTRSGMDAPARAVSGLTPPAKALFVAAAAHAQPHGVVLYVVPGDADLESTCADVAFFLAALEGLAPAAVERAVLPFPSHEVDPYRGLAPHIGVTSVRARALYAIAQGAARVVIASAAAVLPRVTTPERMRAASLTLKPGQDISPVDLADLLVDAGFTREDPADEPGEFAVRGGIADVFPAGETLPVRLEFIGDTIETLRTYDPSTQRSIAPIDQAAIVPLRDVLQDDRGATLFDYLSRASASRIVVSERDEVDANVTKLLDQIHQSYQDIAGAAPRDGARSAAASSRDTAPTFDEDGLPVVERAEPARSRDAASIPTPDEIVVDLRHRRGAPLAGDRSSRSSGSTARCARSAASRPSSSRDASPTGSPTSAACATRARPCCSWRRRRAARSGRSSC